MPRLRPFQKQDVQEIVDHGMHVLLASAQGTGKTPIAISALLRTPDAFPAVVVCPVSMMGTWTRELNTWAKHVTVVSINEDSTRLKARAAGNTVLLVPWNLLHAHKTRLVHAGVKTIIADECHLAKNPDSLRGRALAHLRDRVARIMLITGTPVVNIREDLDILRRYGKRRLHVIRRYLEDVAPDVPKKTRAYVRVQLRAHHRAAYDQAVEDFDEWFRECKADAEEDDASAEQIRRALAADALARVGHLRRLAGEYKVPAAADWISQAVRLGEPVVVFLEHQLVLKKLTRALRRQRIRYVVLDGNSAEAQRDDAVQRFQSNEVPVFIGTRAAKEGLTLTAARHLLFLERFWTSADEEQAEDRIRRIGQNHPTTIWILHAVDTIDDRIDDIVREKRETVRAEVGSVDVSESPQGAVARVLALWSKQTSATRAVSTLGLGAPAEPLPSPSVCHAVVFKPPRWSAQTASAWARMHGYRGKMTNTERLKFEVHPALVFRKGTFRRVQIAHDIYAVVGDRIAKDNERRLHRALSIVDRGDGDRTGTRRSRHRQR